VNRSWDIQARGAEENHLSQRLRTTLHLIVHGRARAKCSSQAFHWFAHKPAVKEIHRVLRAHGCLGMIWNIEDYNAPREHPATTTWEAKAHDLTWSFDDRSPRFRHMQWRKVFEDQSKSTPLSLIIANEQYFALPLGEQTVPFEVWLPREKIWERYSTISHIAVLQGEEREVYTSNSWFISSSYLIKPLTETL